MSGHSHWATIKHKKGRDRRQARQIVEQAQPGHHHRRQERRRRPDHEPEAPLRHRQGPRSVACPRTTSSGPSSAARATRRASPSKKSPTKATVPAASPFSSTCSPTTATAPPARSARSSSAAAARWARLATSASFSNARGCFVVDGEGNDEDTLMGIVLDAGADDLKAEGGQFEITTDPGSFAQVQRGLGKGGREDRIRRGRPGAQSGRGRGRGDRQESQQVDGSP